MPEAAASEAEAELRGWLQTLLAQHAAMLQLHAESVRMQRAVLERLLAFAPAAGTPARAEVASPAPQPPLPPEAPAPPTVETPPQSPPTVQTPRVAAPAVASRGARYYQPNATPPAAAAPAPEHLELLRRLQSMRDAGDLILQFGPHKGSTLAQVALADPAYVRELVTRAQRPEVRAAAGRVAQALALSGARRPDSAAPPPRAWRLRSAARPR